MKSSFRARLSLWNMAILTLLLGAFGLALCLSLRAAMSGAIDRELAARARTYAALPGFPAINPDAAARFPRFLNRAGQNIGDIGAGPWDAAAFQKSLAGAENYSISGQNDARTRVFSLPWRRGGRIVGVIQVARPLREYDRLWAAQFRTLLFLLPVALLAAGAASLFLTERALRPIRQVTRAAGEIGARDLSRRLPVAGDDELAQLSTTFNAMIARLETAFESQRRFSGDASHELRTPLTRIKGQASLALLGTRSPEQLRGALESIDQSCDAMSQLIEDLLLLARSENGQNQRNWQLFDAAPLLCEAAASVPQTGGAKIEFELPDEPLMVQGDAAQLTRVFINLLQNALRHTPSNGRITLWARAEKTQITLGISDTGEGIAPEHLPHLGEPFYRADVGRSRQDGGSGLGLSIASSIVRAHGGMLIIESEIGRGTTVTVELPLYIHRK